MLKLLARDPAHMRLGPGILALRVRPSQPQQEGRDMLALRAQIQHRRCGRCVLNLPKEPNLATSAAVRNRNRIAQLRRIETHESLAIITHDSPSLREALPGLSG